MDKAPDSILKGIAERVKERKLEHNLTQKVFAKRSGAGYDAYRKFENTGEITLHNLVLCAILWMMQKALLNCFQKNLIKTLMNC